MSCFLGHKWTKWRKINVHNSTGFNFDMQQRECTRCGLTKRKTMA